MLEAAVNTQEAVIEKLEEVTRTKTGELSAAVAQLDVVSLERRNEATLHTDLLEAKAAADGRCNSLEAEVDSLRGSQATWQRQKQQLEQRVEDLKVELQITQQSGGGSGDSVAKRDVEMMAAVKDAKIEAMEAQMLENALRFAAEIAELESRNMELGMDARRGSTAGVPQSR
jgi:hypothetical protein